MTGRQAGHDSRQRRDSGGSDSGAHGFKRTLKLQKINVNAGGKKKKNKERKKKKHTPLRMKTTFHSSDSSRSFPFEALLQDVSLMAAA